MQISDLDSDSPEEDNSNQFDVGLREDIVHGIDIHMPVRETDISGQIRRQRILFALGTLGVIGIVALLMVGIKGYRDYLEGTYFINSSEGIIVETGTSYAFDVSLDGTFLFNASLIVGDEYVQGEETCYQVKQVSPVSTDVYYWSIRDDGFYQYLDPNDDLPQIFIPFPLGSGMTWKASIYPSKRYRDSKQAVKVKYTAGEIETLNLPMGPVECIKITSSEDSKSVLNTFWISKEIPIVKLIIGNDGQTFTAELNHVGSVSNP